MIFNFSLKIILLIIFDFIRENQAINQLFYSNNTNNNLKEDLEILNNSQDFLLENTDRLLQASENIFNIGDLTHLNLTSDNTYTKTTFNNSTYLLKYIPYYDLIVYAYIDENSNLILEYISKITNIVKNVIVDENVYTASNYYNIKSSITYEYIGKYSIALVYNKKDSNDLINIFVKIYTYNYNNDFEFIENPKYTNFLNNINYNLFKDKEFKYIFVLQSSSYKNENNDSILIVASLHHYK